MAWRRGGEAGHGNDSAATLVIRNAFTGPVNKLNVCSDSAGMQKESQTREGEREKGMCRHVIEYHLWIGTPIYTEKLMKIAMR